MLHEKSSEKKIDSEMFFLKQQLSLFLLDQLLPLRRSSGNPGPGARAWPGKENCLAFVFPYLHLCICVFLLCPCLTWENRLRYIKALVLEDGLGWYYWKIASSKKIWFLSTLTFFFLFTMTLFPFLIFYLGLSFVCFFLPWPWSPSSCSCRPGRAVLSVVEILTRLHLCV